jgi:hypothetical protein
MIRIIQLSPDVFCFFLDSNTVLTTCLLAMFYIHTANTNTPSIVQTNLLLLSAETVEVAQVSVRGRAIENSVLLLITDRFPSAKFNVI